MKNNYPRPCVLREVGLIVETSFLLSVVDNMAPIESSGQEVKEYNFADDTQFNHTWE
jgi:hypothetical protein